MLVNDYKILEKKKKDDYYSWMYNLDLNNRIRKFTAI